MSVCRDCPRECGADRSVSTGFCGAGEYARIAKTVYPFDYEEPCLGTVAAVFFSGCNLKCSYCQNHKISRTAEGREYIDGELAEMFDGFYKKSVPVDLVTPTHYLSAIERALSLVEKRPRMIYNTSGYETEEGVRRAAKFTDVFLTDFKYADGRLAEKFSAAKDYPERAAKALKIMRETADEFDGKILKRGLIVRHLVLPRCVQNSLDVLEIIKSTVGTDVILSLMSQFTPNGVGEPTERLKNIEYKIVCERAIKLGFNVGYFQGFDSADCKYTPEF